MRELDGKGRGRPLPREGASSRCSPAATVKGFGCIFVPVSTKFGGISGGSLENSFHGRWGGLDSGGRELSSLQEAVSPITIVSGGGSLGKKKKKKKHMFSERSRGLECLVILALFYLPTR